MKQTKDHKKWEEASRGEKAAGIIFLLIVAALAIWLVASIVAAIIPGGESKEPAQRQEQVEERTSKNEDSAERDRQEKARLQVEREAEAKRKRQEEAVQAAQEQAAREAEADRRQLEREEQARRQAAVQRQQNQTPAPSTPPHQGTVHPGAFCSPSGATGVTKTGKPMECKTTPDDHRARWRQR